MSYEITLNAANYISAERQRAFEGSLARNHPGLAQTRASSADTNEPAPAHQSPRADDAEGAPGELTVPTALTAPPDRTGVLESLERGLSQSYDHQSETLRVHQHYLSNESAYTGIVAQLMQDQGVLFAGAQNAPEQSELLLTVMQTLGQSLAQLHDHQSQTLMVHSQFLEQQAAYAQSFVDLLLRHYGSVLHGHGHSAAGGNGNGNGRDHSRGDGGGDGHSASAVQGNGHEPQKVSGIVMRPSEPVRTGRLGVGMPSPVNEIAAASRAVRAAAQLPAAAASKARDVAHPLAASAPVVAVTSSGIPAPVAADVPSTDELVALLLSIVSEKTGYPAEMLNLDMDMEADLGIDSIKRVEILGALEEARPDLPTLPSEALAEIRTLEQIVAATAVRTATADRAVTAVRPGTLPATQAVIEGIPSVTVDQVAPAVVGPDATNAADVTQDLLAIVSEKTGYPAEMLDLSMDMEADLGIDSIKRVEIMGALQETHPGLGEIGAEALGELRTLASILDYVTHTSSVMEAAPPKKA